jgi:hypothetical protein
LVEPNLLLLLLPILRQTLLLELLFLSLPLLRPLRRLLRLLLP